MGLPPGRRFVESRAWTAEKELLGTPPAIAPRRAAATMRVPLFLASLSVVLAGGGTDAPASRSSLGLWWHAPILSGGGYSSEANALLVGLSGLSDAPAVRATQHGDAVDVDFYRGLPPHYRTALDAMMRSRLPAPSDAVVVCHSEPGAWHPQLFHTARCPPPNARVVVGRTMFETDRLDPEHVRRVNAMREVWVPTRWSAAVFEASGVERDKIRVVPEAVDARRFDPNVALRRAPFDVFERGARTLGPPPPETTTETGAANGGLGDDADTATLAASVTHARRSTTVFLSVFKWEARKAPETLLRAYLREFSALDDVALALRCELYHEDRDVTRERVLELAREAYEEGVWSSIPGADESKDFETASRRVAPRVVVLPRVAEDEMPSAYAAADVFVLPSRGEGWGRPHVEAMAMGLPVIATNWSGPTAFMTEENSYPLPIAPRLSRLPRGHHFRNHRWAEPDAEALRALMRRAAERPEEARAKGAAARRDVAVRFSPEAVAKIVVDEVRRIERELDREATEKARGRAGEEL